MIEKLTKNRYSYYEVLSALQKCIRRGLEEDAVRWAIELETFSPYNLWKRLSIIASEDIGPADNTITMLIDLLEQKYWRFKKEGRQTYKLILVHAILAMSRAKKTRAVDELVCILYPEVHLGIDRRPIPDFALDSHTMRGKELGRGDDFFYTESCKVNPDVGSPYTERAREADKKYSNWWKAESARDRASASARKDDVSQSTLQVLTSKKDEPK